jgi:protein-tyrosine phosphatase
MNYIYGSIYILGKKLYNYLSSIPIIRYDKNEAIVRRVEVGLPWYSKYRYFFSESNEVIPSLFLGSSFNAYNKNEIDRKNINIILNITDEIDNFYEAENNITYYKFPISDNNCDDISNILNESYNVIEHHLEIGDRILVHCYMGASRSASVVIHYIMKKYGISYEQTLYLVKKGRPVVNLTEKFQNTLKGSMY